MSKRNRSKSETIAPVAAAADVPRETPVRSAAATLARYRPGYVTADGYRGLSICNGDDVALFLAKHDAAAVMRIAEVVCGLEAGSLAVKYAARNNGMKRMNAGNRIRAAVKAQRTTLEAVKDAARKLATPVL